MALSNKDILVYNSSTSKWNNRQPGATSGIQPYDANISKTDVAETRTAKIDMNNQILEKTILRSVGEEIATISSGPSSIVVDCNEANLFYFYQTKNVSLSFSNVKAAPAVTAITIKRHLDDSGNAYDITFNTTIKWANGTPPDFVNILNTSSGIMFLNFFTDDEGTTWYGSFTDEYS